MHLYLKSYSVTVPNFASVSGTSTQNGLFQTINGLKRLVSYSKLSINNIELLLTIKISYFLFFTYVKISQSTMTKGEFKELINKSSLIRPTLTAIRMPKWIHVWPKLHNEVST